MLVPRVLAKHLVEKRSVPVFLRGDTMPEVANRVWFFSQLTKNGPKPTSWLYPLGSHVVLIAFNFSRTPRNNAEKFPLYTIFSSASS